MNQVHADRAKLVLIDGYSITFRAFFALPALSNARGQFTNAVFGFTQMLLKLLQDEQPTHIAVAFDAGKKTFRHDQFEAYKGKRQETPSELREQFPVVRDLLDAFGIRWLEVPNFEADDIIGTLSRVADAAELPTVIVSGDRDLLQLVSPHVVALLTRKGITEVDRYDPDAIAQRYHLTPGQIVDLKGLMGDTSDNIPGVPGVGEKTALKLLEEYHSVEDILDHVDQISGKLHERLVENRDLALLSKQLATIHRDVPLECTLDDLRYEGYDAAQVRSMFQKLEFKSLVQRISREIDANPAAATDSDSTGADAEGKSPAFAWQNAKATIIRTPAELAALTEDLGDPIGIVPDFGDGDYQTANLVGFGIGSRDRPYYVDLTDELSITDLGDLLAADCEKVVFDLKTLYVLMDAHGETLESDGTWFDVMLATYLLNPSEGEVRVTDVLERELHVSLAVPAPGSEQRPACLARLAIALAEARPHISSALSAQDLDDLFNQVEMPLAFVLARMEALGFYVNTNRLREIGGQLQTRLDALSAQIYELAGTQFNLNSPRQLGDILFDQLGLPATKKTKTGYSTSADVLERLAPYHEIVGKILDYRQVGKLLSTYVEGLLKVVRSETGRVHTRFHQALTATGRLSSSEPNLQNIPVRMEEGRQLRQAFEATYDDWVIVSADYSQIELRILAHLSGDEALIAAFRQGMDIHTRTAADVFEVDAAEVTSLMRRQAKAVNFGIVYGISDYGLAQNLNIPRAQAGQFIEGYFAKFPGVRKYMDDIVEGAHKQGYVTTLLNRRRYLPDLHNRNFNLRSFAERTAMNTPIQGTAADIIKLAMVRIDQALRQSDLKARMLLQVHDELIFECPQADVHPLVEVVRDNMENALTLNVPLQVDIHVGKTWYDAK